MFGTHAWMEGQTNTSTAEKHDDPDTLHKVEAQNIGHQRKIYTVFVQRD